MNKIVITNRKGVTQHARLIKTDYADDWDIEHQHCSAFVTGIDYQWWMYVHLEDITAYAVWRRNLERLDMKALAAIAHDNEHNLFKGWAALVLLTEDVVDLSDDELSCSIDAALRHKETLIGRNALQQFQYEQDQRELGYEGY